MYFIIFILLCLDVLTFLCHSKKESSNFREVYTNSTIFRNEEHAVSVIIKLLTFIYAIKVITYTGVIIYGFGNPVLIILCMIRVFFSTHRYLKGKNVFEVDGLDANLRANKSKSASIVQSIITYLIFGMFLFM